LAFALISNRALAFDDFGTSWRAVWSTGPHISALWEFMAVDFYEPEPLRGFAHKVEVAQL